MIQIYDYPFSLDACILLLLYHTLTEFFRNIFAAAGIQRHAVRTADSGLRIASSCYPSTVSLLFQKNHFPYCIYIQKVVLL